MMIARTLVMLSLLESQVLGVDETQCGTKDADSEPSVLLQAHFSPKEVAPKKPTSLGTAPKKPTSLGTAELGQSAATARTWLGRGMWVAKQDFWSMTHLTSVGIFTDSIPDECFEPSPCPTGSRFEYQYFSSVTSWSRYYSSLFGIKLSGAYGGFSASVSASLDSTDYSNGTVEKNVTFASSESIAQCYRLVRKPKCAYKEEYVEPTFMSRVEQLPKGKPYTAEKMAEWKRGFIDLYGTHMTIGSSHGAWVKSLASVETRTESSSSCGTSSLCVEFGWVKAASASVNLCANSSSCDAEKTDAISLSATCTALGGDATLQPQICGKTVEESTLDDWLTQSQPTQSSSLVRYTFEPLSTFLRGVNFTKYDKSALALEMAVEYSNCRLGQTPPVQQWSEESGCQCVRECHNGGILDEASCTCSCPGNAQHGWTGGFCTEEYGTCQPGAGTGNKQAASSCSLHNVCASFFHAARCTASQECCATDFGTTCCPYGSTCDCKTNSCSCI